MKKITISEIIDTFSQEVTADKVAIDFKDISTQFNTNQIFELIIFKMFVINKAINDCLSNKNTSQIIIDNFHENICLLIKKIVGINKNEFDYFKSTVNKRYNSYYKCFDGKENFTLSLSKELSKNLKLKDNFKIQSSLGITASSLLISYAELINKIDKNYQIINK